MIAVFHLLQESLAALLALLAVGGCVFAIASGCILEGYGELSLPLAGGRDRMGRLARGLNRRHGGADLRAAGPSGEAPPSVALFKPLHGAEPGLAANLDGFVAQDYPGRADVWLGLQAEGDAAAPVARALAAAHPERVRLVLDPRRRAGNAKVGNLMNLADAAAATGADLVVVTDSDIGVPPGWLTAVVEALERSDVGLASCLYYGTAARPGVAARIGAMGVSYGFLPQGAAGVAIGARPAMGSTIALSRETLEALGGFAAVKDVLADDYELGRAVRRLGLEVVSPPVLVSHDSAESTLAELWRHELRWSTTIRSLDPSGYAGSLVTHYVPIALLAVVLSGFKPLPIAVLVVSILARLWLKGRVDAVVGAPTGPWWLLPPRDMLSLAVFLAAWFARRVDWKGLRFHVGRDGEMTPV